MATHASYAGSAGYAVPLAPTVEGPSRPSLRPTTVEPAATGRAISPDEVRQHASRDSAWIALFGKVYDVTDFIAKHPGGEEVILAGVGQDVTAHWRVIHKKEILEQYMKPEWCLGSLVTPPGVSPLQEHGVAEGKKVKAETGDIVYSVTEDFKQLKKRKQRQLPISCGETCKVIDALLRIQSELGNKDVLMEKIVGLIEERGDPNCTDQDGKGGNTPLLIAANVGSDEQVLRLITTGADPLYKTECGVTALHKFAARRLPDARASSVLHHLLEAKCEINAAMWQGRTPLHIAAQWGQADMCRMLLDNGAMPRLRAGMDGTAADWAKQAVTDKHKLKAVLSVLERATK